MLSKRYNKTLAIVLVSAFCLLAAAPVAQAAPNFSNDLNGGNVPAARVVETEPTGFLGFVMNLLDGIFAREGARISGNG